MIDLWFALFLIACSGVGGYYYGRIVEATRALPISAPAPAPQIVPAPEIAEITIQLLGRTIKTNMAIEVPLLEQLANGIGKTLIDKTSRGMH